MWMCRIEKQQTSRYARGSGGFTLIELIVVVAIVAILATVALSSYGTYVTRSKLVEAQNALANYYVQMEQYFQDNRNYGAGACGVVPSSVRYFDFTCELNGTGGFVATATGRSREGAEGFTFTIDQSNVRATTAVPPDWTLPPDHCWISNKGGACA